MTAREGPEQRDVHTLERVLGELQQLEREILELEYVRRSDHSSAFVTRSDAWARSDPPVGILARAADELGTSSQFDRILISEIVNGSLLARSIWARGGPRGRTGSAGHAPTHAGSPRVPLDRRGGGPPPAGRDRDRQLSTLPHTHAPCGGAGLGRVRGGCAHGRRQTVGMLHADANGSGRPLDDLDREVAVRYSEGLAEVFERAVLRETLQRHRRELQSAVQWMSGRLSQLTAQATVSGSVPSRVLTTAGAIDALTPRELEVLRLMARGQTNIAIANALVVREGTVKYHVKNILRKLGATSRADAVARYARTGSSLRP